MKMCQAFGKQGNKTILITPDRVKCNEPGIQNIFSFYGVEKCFEIKYIYYPPLKISILIYSTLAAICAKKLRPDLVYGRDVIGCFMAAILKQQVVFESHEPINFFLYKCFFKSLIHQSTFKKLVVISHTLQEYYCKKYPLLLGKIMVLPDGADPISQSDDHDVFNNHHKLRIGYTGHLYPGRGIEIIEKLATRFPDVDFHIIGGTEQDIMQRTISNFQSNNLFFHGFKEPRETDRYRLGCDILIAPYQNNIKTANWMSPLKIFEYMAAGKAIICSDIPVLKEVLKHNHNAFLCPPNDIPSWESAITVLIEDEPTRIRLGNNAYSDFINNYTWHSRARKICDLFK